MTRPRCTPLGKYTEVKQIPCGKSHEIPLELNNALVCLKAEPHFQRINFDIRLQKGVHFKALNLFIKKKKKRKIKPIGWHSFWTYSARQTAHILASFREETVNGSCRDVSRGSEDFGIQACGPGAICGILQQPEGVSSAASTAVDFKGSLKRQRTTTFSRDQQYHKHKHDNKMWR